MTLQRLAGLCKPREGAVDATASCPPACATQTQALLPLEMMTLLAPTAHDSPAGPPVIPTRARAEGPWTRAPGSRPGSNRSRVQPPCLISERYGNEINRANRQFGRTCSVGTLRLDLMHRQALVEIELMGQVVDHRMNLQRDEAPGRVDGVHWQPLGFEVFQQHLDAPGGDLA